MNTKFALLTLSIAIAVTSLALCITVVGRAASNATGVAIGIEPGAFIRNDTDNRLLADQRTNISQEEPLSLTEPISIYLPLLSTAGYLDKSAERAALIALYNSTNGDDWYHNTGWGTNGSFCEWYGVTCDENGDVTILDLGANKLSGTLPPEIGDLPMLTVLRLGGTQEDCNKGGCQYFYAIGEPFPPEIGKLMNLRVLDLTGNKLTSLPPEIGNLLNLQMLYLGGLWGSVGNRLTSLPPEIGNLVNLQVLDLRYNRLTSLPREIGNLVNLQVLYLGGWWYWNGNRLTSLPAEIGHLVNLQVLDLSYNQLALLPGEIGNLVNLLVLRVNDNRLTLLPPVYNLASLQELDLGNNHLSGSIPAFLSNLGDLNYLSLWGNPNLTCWETEEARDWALSLSYYGGPTCVLSK